MRQLSVLLACGLVASACNLKVTGDAGKPVGPKPDACARSLVRDVPRAFTQVGQPAGAVRTANCDILVVGRDSAGETVIAKYDAQGQPDLSFGDNSVLKPFQSRYNNMNQRFQRLAIVNGGFYALGSYHQSGRPRALFAFRFLDSGFLDLAFGPLRDGVARASTDERYSLTSVGVPVIEAETIRMRNRLEDTFNGTEIERDQLLPVSGSEAMAKDIQPVPAACDILNHQAYKQQTMYQITQSGCGELSWRSNGPMGSDAITVIPNGTSYFSNVLGEMRWFYEGRTMVLVSRNGLGFVKKEYANFVQGRTSMCGVAVDVNRRYLVFSAKSPRDADWLTHCWFL